MVTTLEVRDNVVVIHDVRKIQGFIVKCKEQSIIIRQWNLVMMIGHKVLEIIIQYKAVGIIFRY